MKRSAFAKRPTLVLTTFLLGSVMLHAAEPAAGPNTTGPNFVVIFIDDMGYSDIGCFGSKVHRTPNIDRMAEEGMRMTDFYSTCSVCTPSRSSLMTGCYPRRVNMHVDERDLCVLFPGARKGLNPDEITIAEVLKTRGYATACIGKWHLGDHPDFLPTRQGFDYYYGIPYSNDMHRKTIPLPLMRNTTVVEAPVDQDTITRRYTEETIKFITANKDKPFFVYLPHAMVHVPLHPGEAFKGKSSGGAYGDAVEELDWSTGAILDTLEKLGIDDRTLVLFTSDNGSPRQTSNVPLRGTKGRTDEGGMREPCVVWWPGKIPAGTACSEVTSTIDLLPTFVKLAGAEAPADRIIDGRDIWPLLSGRPGVKSPHEAYYYYQMDQLQAVRSGKWKLFVEMESKKRNWGKPEGRTPAKLFDLSTDIHEDNDVKDQHPEVVARLLALAEKAREDLGDMQRAGKNQRPAGWVETPHPQLLPTK